MSTVLHLIAVGESSWTRFHRLEGVRDISLSEKGRVQMLDVARGLRETPLRDIHYARTTRGNQAAKLIHDELCKNEPFMQQLRRQQRVKPGKVESGMERGNYFSLTKRNKYASIKLYRDERLNDINYGALQGLYEEEIDARYSDIWEQFQKEPLQTHFPHGESMSQVLSRAQDFLAGQKYNELYDVHIGVVTHIPIIQLITCLATVRDVSAFREIPCTDGNISVVQYA